jgi:hypothetical protein
MILKDTSKKYDSIKFICLAQYWGKWCNFVQKAMNLQVSQSAGNLFASSVITISNRKALPFPVIYLGSLFLL